LNPILAIIVY